MDTIDSRQAYLQRIALVTATHRFALGGDSPEWPSSADGPDAKAARKPTLASEAMRWTYVLRSRERWKGDERAVGQQERSATKTLYAFGLGDQQLRDIAVAGVVMVEMPYTTEAEGWAGRVFPWSLTTSKFCKLALNDGE